MNWSVSCLPATLVAACLLAVCLTTACACGAPPDEPFKEPSVSPFLAAEKVLAEYVQSHGSAVEIIAGDGQVTTTKANLGQTRARDQGGGGRSLPATITQTVDFIVPTAALSGAITVSHRVVHEGVTYRPVPIDGEPIARDSGRHGLLTRIHTVRAG